MTNYQPVSVAAFPYQLISIADHIVQEIGQNKINPLGFTLKYDVGYQHNLILIDLTLKREGLCQQPYSNQIQVLPILSSEPIRNQIVTQFEEHWNKVHGMRSLGITNPERGLTGNDKFSTFFSGESRPKISH